MTTESIIVVNKCITGKTYYLVPGLWEGIDSDHLPVIYLGKAKDRNVDKHGGVGMFLFKKKDTKDIVRFMYDQKIIVDLYDEAGALKTITFKDACDKLMFMFDVHVKDKEYLIPNPNNPLQLTYRLERLRKQLADKIADLVNRNIIYSESSSSSP